MHEPALIRNIVETENLVGLYPQAVPGFARCERLSSACITLQASFFCME
jgi:hypothetical protein